MKPTVSVGIITYNHAPFIRQCLLSILEQITQFEVEIVVGEDCSTDGTREEIQRVMAEFPGRITALFHNQNLGALHNGYDCVMPACRGEFVALCEGDDLWNDCHKLQKQVDYLRAHPDCVLTCHDASVVNEKGELVVESRLKNHEKKELTAIELGQGGYVLALTMCFRNRVRSFPQELYKSPNGDLFLCVLLSEFGYCHYHSDINPAKYRSHHGGVWSLRPQIERWKNALITYSQLIKYLDGAGRKSLRDFYIYFSIDQQETIFIHCLSHRKYADGLKSFFNLIGFTMRHRSMLAAPRAAARLIRMAGRIAIQKKMTPTHQT